jgi:hypothetical protein
VVKNGKWRGSLEVKGEKWGIENFEFSASLIQQKIKITQSSSL